MSPLVAAAGLATTVTVVRTISPREFAIYAVVLSFKVVVQFASDFGTGAAATRLFGELHARAEARSARRAYARLLAVRAGFAAALVIAVALFPDDVARLLRLDDDERGVIPFLAAIGAVETASSLGYSVLAGMLRHRWLNRVTLLAAVAQPVAVIIAAATGSGLVGISAALLLGSALRTGGLHLGAVLALRDMEGDEEATPGLTRTYMRTATGSVAGKVASFVHSRQPVTLIVIQSTGRAEVAVFALAYDFVQQNLAALTSPFNSLVLPMQAAAVGDEERGRATYRTAVRLLALVVVPASAVLLALFPPLVEVLFGRSYEDATLFALVFVPMVAVEAVLATPATALMLADDRVLGVYGRIKMATVVLGVAYVALAQADLLVIAAVMAAIRTASTGALVLVLRSRLGLETGGPWVAGLFATAAGGAAAALMPALVLDGAVARLVVSSVLAGAAVLALLRWLRVVSPPDAALATDLLPPLRPLFRLVAPG